MLTLDGESIRSRAGVDDACQVMSQLVKVEMATAGFSMIRVTFCVTEFSLDSFFRKGFHNRAQVSTARCIMTGICSETESGSEVVRGFRPFPALVDCHT